MSCPPMFDCAPSMLHKPDGSVLFECMCMSNPEPEVKWFFKDKQLTGDRYVTRVKKTCGKYTCTLIVKNPTNADQGKYKVVATNKNGTHEVEQGYVNTFLLIGCLSFCAESSLQSVGVSGTLMCGSTPLADTLVKLWDEDDGPDPDEELNSTLTNYQGYFKLSGYTDEWTSIEPRLKIYHNCNNYHHPCLRKVKIKIPDQYINNGFIVSTSKWFDAGRLNMEMRFRGERTKCF
uniref:Ig-like domain-containing protein n=1 Tax=Plectus sambesii TaxID=2011161 RepID=A0A914WUF3_9BILA